MKKTVLMRRVITIFFISVLIAFFLPNKIYQKVEKLDENDLEKRLDSLNKREYEKYQEFKEKGKIVFGLLDDTILYTKSFGDFDYNYLRVFEDSFSEVLGMKTEIVVGDFESVKNSDVLIMDNNVTLSDEYQSSNVLFGIHLNVYSQSEVLNLVNIKSFDGDIIINQYSKNLLEYLIDTDGLNFIIKDDEELFDTFIDGDNSILIVSSENFYVTSSESSYNLSEYKHIYSKYSLGTIYNRFSAESEATMGMLEKLMLGSKTSFVKKKIKYAVIKPFVSEIFDENEEFSRFMNKEKIFNISYFPDNFPYVYDEENELFNGVYREIFEQLKKVLGIDYNVVNIKDESRCDIESRAKNPESGLILNVPFLFEDENTLLSMPVMENEYVLISKIGHPSLNNVSEISGSKIGAFENVIKMYPEMFAYVAEGNTIQFKNTVDVINAVKNNVVDYGVIYKWEYEKYIEERKVLEEKTLLKSILLLDEAHIQGYIAVNKAYKDADLIIEMLNKILPLLDYNNYEINEVRKHVYEISLGVYPKIKTTLLFYAGISVLSYLGLIIYEQKTKGVQRELENRKRLAEMAMKDELTGLKNRTALYYDYQGGSFQGLTFIYIDLDDFKDINDAYGHEAGDIVLKELSQRFMNLGDKTDVYRMGGDEFLLITSDLREGDTPLLILTISNPVKGDHIQYIVHGSVGVVDVSIFKNQPILEEIINLSDFAMFEAKEKGKNQTVIASLETINKYQLRKELDLKIFDAVNGKDFIPYFQPYINLLDSSIVGYEALARWKTKDKIFPPEKFIPVALKTGLIYNIDLMIFENSVKFLRKLKDIGLYKDGFIVSSNFSSITLSRLKLDSLLDILKKYGIKSNEITLEITERSQLEDVGIENIKALKNAGFKIAIDDFSAGHSSLVQLNDLNVDVMKIDKLLFEIISKSGKTCFNCKDREECSKYHIYKTIVDLGKRLNMEVVSEGVEHYHNIETLKFLNVGIVQGFYYLEPVKENEFLDFILKHKSSKLK